MAIEWKTLSLGKINRSYILYSSKIRGLCWLKWPSENSKPKSKWIFLFQKYVKVGKTLQGHSKKHKSQISEEWHVMANVGHIYVSISIL